MSLRNFIKDQIKNNNVDWESKSALIRSAGETVNGHSNRILKEFEDNEARQSLELLLNYVIDRKK